MKRWKEKVQDFFGLENGTFSDDVYEGISFLILFVLTTVLVYTKEGREVVNTIIHIFLLFLNLCFLLKSISLLLKSFRYYKKQTRNTNEAGKVESKKEDETEELSVVKKEDETEGLYVAKKEVKEEEQDKDA